MIEQWAAHGPRHLTEPGTSGLVEVRILLAHIPIQLAEHVSGKNRWTAMTSVSRCLHIARLIGCSAHVNQICQLGQRICTAEATLMP